MLDEVPDRMIVFVILLVLSAYAICFAIFRVNRHFYEMEEASDLEKENEGRGW
jgi:hypothetical protein